MSVDRERAESWLLEAFEASMVIDDRAIRTGADLRSPHGAAMLARIAADAIERVWAEAPYELNTREDTWYRPQIPWGAVIEENQAP